MPIIQVRHLSGEVETRVLAKNKPLSVGCHPSSDIVIDDDGIAVIHCRISWNKSGYEAVAATPDGIDVNGAMVRNARLTPGDIIRVGSVDLVYLTSADEAVPAEAAAATSTGDIKLKPLSEDEVRPSTTPSERVAG